MRPLCDAYTILAEGPDGCIMKWRIQCGSERGNKSTSLVLHPLKMFVIANRIE